MEKHIENSSNASEGNLQPGYSKTENSGLDADTCNLILSEKNAEGAIGYDPIERKYNMQNNLGAKIIHKSFSEKYF
jgi:hypothetical protein